MWVSPYLRTRQTADIIEENLESELLTHGRREHIALCEQSFGLFDGISDEDLPNKFPKEHAHYKKYEKDGGRFWAPIPLGERRSDVALRVHNSFGTFQRDLDKHGINTLIVVSHGVTIRAFLMMWLHRPYEWFEQEPNPGNCSIQRIHNGENEIIFSGYDCPGDLSSPVWP